ncbi:hypothetical protein Tdes44962_MAKER03804 [Teratosphaeria destructans]|uniref:Uncharacterized protein n=1 Tax=Teratosphaeria destructans TaxID=418781 RepID=A0A9W7SNU4_9PEZI|nr:hypothetical protein Tdes44962_MAKER03804 [Teratosphaeria destructans]
MQDIHIQLLHYLDDQAQRLEESIDRHPQHAVGRGFVVDPQHVLLGVVGRLSGENCIRAGGVSLCHEREGALDEWTELLVDPEGAEGGDCQALGREGNVYEPVAPSVERISTTQSTNLQRAGKVLVEHYGRHGSQAIGLISLDNDDA